MVTIINIENIIRFYRGKIKRYIMDFKDLKTNGEKKLINYEINRIKIDEK